MLSSLKCERYKIWHGKKFIILCLVAIGLGALTVYLNKTMYIAGKIQEFSGLNAMMNSMSNLSVTVILSSIFLACSIGNEFQNRTLQFSIAYGIARRKIFASKAIVNIIACSILSLLYPITLTIGTTIFAGWGNDIVSIQQISIKLVSGIIMQIAIICICFGIEFISKGTKAGLVFNIVVVGVGFSILQSMSNGLELLKKILVFTPIGYLDSWTRENVDMNFWVKMIIVNLVWGTVSLLVSYLIFKKRDLK